MNGNVNFAFALLRIWGAFAVVSIHFGRTIPCATISVPIFMAMAFYFFNVNVDCNGLQKRLFRLVVPIIVWGGIGFVYRCISEGKIDLSLLALQLCFGMPANSPLYFMNLVIANTIVIWSIFRFLGKRAVPCCLALVISCLALQYAEINYEIWKWLPRVGEITFGRFVELLPAAIMGSMIGLHKHLLNGRYAKLLTVFFALMYACLWFSKIDVDVDGYGYQGLTLLSGTVAVCLFASLCSNMAIVGFKGRLVSFCSGLTAGIYYTHQIVGEILKTFIPFKNILLTLSVFILAGVITYIIQKYKRLKIIVK